MDNKKKILGLTTPKLQAAAVWTGLIVLIASIGGTMFAMLEHVDNDALHGEVLNEHLENDDLHKNPKTLSILEDSEDHVDDDSIHLSGDQLENFDKLQEDEEEAVETLQELERKVVALEEKIISLEREVYSE